MGTHRESLTSDITCLAYSLFFWINVAFCPQRTHVWLLFVSLQFLLFYRCHCARHRSVTLASSLIHRHRLYILICYLPSFGWCVQPFFFPNIPHFFYSPEHFFYSVNMRCPFNTECFQRQQQKLYSKLISRVKENLNWKWNGWPKSKFISTI